MSSIEHTRSIGQEGTENTTSPASALLAGLDVEVGGELEVRHLNDFVVLYIGSEDGHEPLEVTVPTEHVDTVSGVLTSE